MVMDAEGYGWPYAGMATEIKVAQTHAIRRTRGGSLADHRRYLIARQNLSLCAIERAMHRRQRIFQASCAVEKHGLLVAADAAVRERLLERGIGRGAFRTHQEDLPRARPRQPPL